MPAQNEMFTATKHQTPSLHFTLPRLHRISLAMAAPSTTPLLPSLCFTSSHRGTKIKLSIEVAQLSSTSQLSQLRVSSWSGLKNLGVPSAVRFLCLREKKKKCHGKAVYASLFGVGAPEALVIGVVALLVFGPKGLAEVARNLGKTLRSFQPTIRELQEVSREFKSTLEREIGLDEVAASTNANKSALKTENKEQSVVDPNGKLSTGPQTYDELLKISENQLAESAEKSPIEASGAEEQVQVPDSGKSELEATLAEEQVQGLGAEKSQEESPTVEDHAQVLNATQSEGEITVVGEEPKEVSPTAPASEIASPAQVASEVQSSHKSSETEETVAT